MDEADALSSGSVFEGIAFSRPFFSKHGYGPSIAPLAVTLVTRQPLVQACARNESGDQCPGRVLCTPAANDHSSRQPSSAGCLSGCVGKMILRRPMRGEPQKTLSSLETSI